MDHAAVNRLFVADLLAALSHAGQGEPGLVRSASPADEETDDDQWLEVLDIGTGTAQIPIELCRQFSAARVTAIDLATSMLYLGRGNVEVAGLTGRIRLDRVDAKQMPYDDGHFAVVISNSIVHHIPQPVEVLREGLRVLADDGLLFVRDLLCPADDATVDHLVATYAPEANPHQRQLFNQSLRAALSLAEVEELAAAVGLPRHSVRQTSDRHWTLSARKSRA